MLWLPITIIKGVPPGEFELIREAGRRCHGVVGLVADEHDENQLFRISVRSGDHSPGDLQLDRALDYVRGGDTLVVTKVDRLARSTIGLWDIVKRLEAVDDGGCGLRILNPGGEVIDARSATGRPIVTIFAGLAQFEREIMLERRRQGIRKAQAAGKYLGRKPSASLKAGEAIAVVSSGKSIAATAKALGIIRASVHTSTANGSAG